MTGPGIRATARSMVSFTDASDALQGAAESAHGTDQAFHANANRNSLQTLGLNAPQLEAVGHDSGPLLVLAGAGSGKTRVIVYRIAQLIAVGNVPPYQILAVTFTNKAAREMRTRVQALLGCDIAANLWMGTFHATCARLLRSYHEHVGLKRSFVIYDTSDQLAVVNRVARTMNLDPREIPPKWLLSQIHYHKHAGIYPEQVPIERQHDAIVANVYDAYQQGLRMANAVDFDDLILLVTTLAENTDIAVGSELQRKFRHVLVDEFQDVNAIQYRLVRALGARHGNVCVVGDDDQSIYRWRGADVGIIRGFSRDFPGTRTVKLEQNYRSSKNIVRTALAVIQPSQHRQPKNLFTHNHDGEVVRVVTTRDERDEAYEVVRTVERALRAGTPAQQIAVFYRIHAQSRVLEEALRTAKIAYQIIGGTRFFDRAEIKDLLAYLRVLINPSSDVDLVRIINVPARRIGTSTIQKLVDCASKLQVSVFDVITSHLDRAGLSSATQKRVHAFGQMMLRLQFVVANKMPLFAAKKVLETTQYIASLEQEDTAEADARINNLQELLGSISEFEQQAEAAGDEPTLSDYLEQVSLVSDVDQQKDIDAISLMTIHAAKGLEFDCVLVTGFEQDLLPYRFRTDMQPFSPDEYEEERRLAYVAFSRARKALTILHTQCRTIFGSFRYSEPSHFLRNLPSECIYQEHTAIARSSIHPHLQGEMEAEAHPIKTSIQASTLQQLKQQLAALQKTNKQALSVPSREEKTGQYIEIDNPSPFPSTDPIGPGMRVDHPRFGPGKVVSLKAETDPAIAVVQFEQVGTKSIIVKYLRILD